MLSNIELFEHFKYLNWLIYKFNENINTDQEHPYDVSRGQGRILATLLMEDSISTKDLAKRTGMNISSLNELLAKLEKKDFIKRVPYPKDKRIIVNCLTEKAKEFHPKIDLNFFNCLSEEEKIEFNHLIEKISLNIEKSINQLGNEEFKTCYINRKNSFQMFLDKVKMQELNEC